MAFTKHTCEESGVWAGRCGHAQVVVSKGERFPECAGCHRGIDWHLVRSQLGAALKELGVSVLWYDVSGFLKEAGYFL